MSIKDLKFNAADFSGKDISSLPDRPGDSGITGQQLKERFDQIPKIMVAMGGFNDLIDELNGANGAENIGVTPVEGLNGGNIQQIVNEVGGLIREATNAANTAAEQGIAATAAANDAKTAATAATAKAEAAEVAASGAITAANSATNAANSANTAATNAEKAVTEATKAASAATVAATEASEAAATASAKANAAATAANNATSKATAAETAANTATAKADTAASQGAAAATAATAATTAANNAAAAANQATAAIQEVKNYADEKAQEAKDYVDNAILEGGAVTSVFGRAGAVKAQAGDYTANMVGAIPASEKGTANGVATLGSNGKVPASQLPDTNAVSSVFGRVGTIVAQAGDYTAAMVGARSNTWMPTASEVGARSNTWMPNAAETGAAPSIHASQHSSNGADPIIPENIGAIPTNEKGAVNGVATLDSNGKVTAEQSCSTRNSITADRTINADDAGKLLLCYSANVTVTIPTGLPINTEIEICRWSTYTVTIAAASGVTIRSTETARTIKSPYGCVCLKKITVDEIWLLTGDLG